VNPGLRNAVVWLRCPEPNVVIDVIHICQYCWITRDEVGGVAGNVDSGKVRGEVAYVKLVPALWSYLPERLEVLSPARTGRPVEGKLKGPGWIPWFASKKARVS